VLAAQAPCHRPEQLDDLEYDEFKKTIQALVTG
jgi:hypothetical protein